MRRVKVNFRPEALADLRDIHSYVTDRSKSAVVASRFVKRIIARCRKIGEAPNGGRPRDDLAEGLRTVPFEHSAVIAYIVTDAVEIANVFYGGRDYETLFHDAPADE